MKAIDRVWVIACNCDQYNAFANEAMIRNKTSKFIWLSHPDQLLGISLGDEDLIIETGEFYKLREYAAIKEQIKKRRKLWKAIQQSELRRKI